MAPNSKNNESGEIILKKLIALLLAITALLSLSACGGGSDLPSLSGYYECESYAFDISALEFESDGTVTFYMDWNYTGTYKAKGDGYVLEITGGQSSVSDLLAKEKNDAYKITVEPNDDETLTVYLKAKSGYIYYGDPSAVFSPKS
ncbi:hypothetical protein MR857_14475 [bacterium]|nr:hypothetical protein [bacterium]MCI6430283.1 hypothetical protein [Lachnospiraceae bacterium]MDY5026732.1 hypothetical protein [Oliverpabstia sp.]